jgi:hypothetical protein
MLLSGDKAKITIHIRSLTMPLTFNYIERLEGPWQIETTQTGAIASLVAQDQEKNIQVLEAEDAAYLFEIKGKHLGVNQEYMVAYEAIYQ